MLSILVIDDEPAMRDVIRMALESRAYQVVEAPDLSAGLTLFRDVRPALVITDIRVGRESALDAIREMREIDPEARVIAISGAVEARAADPLRKAEALGAAATLEKPFRRQQLLDVVARVLEAR